MNTNLVSIFLFLLVPATLAGQQIGTVTLVEGTLRLIRGTVAMKGLEGMRLNQGDILESAGAGFAQLEFEGGTIVVLGPSSRLFVLSHPSRVGSRPPNAPGAELILLSGWLKGETSPKLGIYRYDTPLLAAMTKDGTVVLYTAGESAEIFIESGSATVAQLTSDGFASHPTAGKAGQYFSRSAGKSWSVAARPASTFVSAVPRPFRDTLPSRLSRFAGKPVEPSREHEVVYSEIRPWLVTSSRFRKDFVSRFQPRLKDPVFREQIEIHLAEHPEWDRALHPEKYPPKEPASPVSSSDSPQRRQSQ